VDNRSLCRLWQKTKTSIQRSRRFIHVIYSESHRTRTAMRGAHHDVPQYDFTKTFSASTWNEPDVREIGD